MFERGLAVCRDLGAGVHMKIPLLLGLANAQLGFGNVVRGRALADETVAILEQRHSVHRADAHILLARARRLAEGAAAREAIAAALARATAFVEESGARLHLPFIHAERAALAQLVGDEAGHVRELREAQRLFTQIGAPLRAAQMARELGS